MDEIVWSENEIDIDAAVIEVIQDQVYEAEQQQLHLEKPHKILPEIKDIIKSEVQ